VYHTINGITIEQKIIIIKEKNNHSKTKTKSFTSNIKEIKNNVVIEKEIIQKSGCNIMKPTSSLTLLIEVLGKIRLRNEI